MRHYNFSRRVLGRIFPGFGVICAMAVLLGPLPLRAEPIGDLLWNYRTNSQDFCPENRSWLRPWNGNDESEGIWVDNLGGGCVGTVPWMSFDLIGNADGSFSLNNPQDMQFHAWTYVYVENETVISLPADRQDTAAPRWFLNAVDPPYNFDDYAEYPPTWSIDSGWSRIDITGYNQNQGYSFWSGPLQVDTWGSDPIPEPSALSLLVVAGLLLLGLRRAPWSRLVLR